MSSMVEDDAETINYKFYNMAGDGRCALHAVAEVMGLPHEDINQLHVFFLETFREYKRYVEKEKYNSPEKKQEFQRLNRIPTVEIVEEQIRMEKLNLATLEADIEELVRSRNWNSNDAAGSAPFHDFIRWWFYIKNSRNFNPNYQMVEIEQNHRDFAEKIQYSVENLKQNIQDDRARNNEFSPALENGHLIIFINNGVHWGVIFSNILEKENLGINIGLRQNWVNTMAEIEKQSPSSGDGSSSKKPPAPSSGQMDIEDDDGDEKWSWNRPPRLATDREGKKYLEVHKKMNKNDILYTFIDNLHDFADEGSLNGKIGSVDVATIALYTAYSFCYNEEGVKDILVMFAELLKACWKNPIFQQDAEITKENIIETFKNLIVEGDNQKNKGEEIKNFLTKRGKENFGEGAQQYLYRKFYEQDDRVFVKNPKLIEKKNYYYSDSQTTVKELAPIVTCVSPKSYLQTDDVGSDYSETISFNDTPAWDALLNASCEKYDGSDVFGKFPILQKYLVDNKNVEKKNKLTQNILEYKLSVETKDYEEKHKNQRYFDLNFAGESKQVNKYYCFGPDAVNKVRALSSVFHNMQKHHKFGLSEIPDKQTIHNTSISFDMANSTITQPIKPILGEFQNWTNGKPDDVEADTNTYTEHLLTKPIYTYLYSYPNRRKRMVIKQIPYQNKESFRFANTVYTVYENLLYWVNKQIKDRNLQFNGVDDAIEQRLSLAMEFFQGSSTQKEFNHTIDGYDLNKKQNREIDPIEGTDKIDLLTDLTTKDGISLFQQMSGEAKEFYETISSAYVTGVTDEYWQSKEDWEQQANVIAKENYDTLFGEKSIKALYKQESEPYKVQENHNTKGIMKYPYVSSKSKKDARSKETIGARKYYASFKPDIYKKDKGKFPEPLGDDMLFFNYLIYLFMCDMAEIEDIATGEKKYDLTAIPTEKNSVMRNKFLEHYKNAMEGDSNKADSFPVRQTIHFEQMQDDKQWTMITEEYEQIKQGKKGPSVTYQEYNYRKLILSLAKSTVEIESKKLSAPLNTVIEATKKKAMDISKKQLKGYIDGNEKRNPLRSKAGQKDKKGPGRGGTLPDSVKDPQLKMLNYLFEKAHNGELQNQGFEEKAEKHFTKTTDVDGVGMKGKYESDQHEFICKSSKKFNKSGPDLEFLCKTLWMPVATKWTSDFIQCVMNRAVQYIAGKSTFGKYTLFTPCTFDITCGSGGMREGSIMFEKIAGNGVLHATRINPQIHSKLQKTLQDSKLFVQEKEDPKKWSKFKKALLNFAPGVIDTYLEILGKKKKEKMKNLNDRDIKFIEHFYKNLTGDFGEGPGFDVLLTTIHWLKKICFKYENPVEYANYEYLNMLIKESQVYDSQSNNFYYNFTDSENEHIVQEIEELNQLRKELLIKKVKVESEIFEMGKKLKTTAAGTVIFKEDPELLGGTNDEFKELFLADHNRALGNLKINIQQIEKTIEKMKIYLKTKSMIQFSQESFAKASVQVKDTLGNWEDSVWIHRRSGILAGIRNMLYYHNNPPFNIPVLPNTSTGDRRGVYMTPSGVEETGRPAQILNKMQEQENQKLKNVGQSTKIKWSRAERKKKKEELMLKAETIPHISEKKGTGNFGDDKIKEAEDFYETMALAKEAKALDLEGVANFFESFSNIDLDLKLLLNRKLKKKGRYN